MGNIQAGSKTGLGRKVGRLVRGKKKVAGTPYSLLRKKKKNGEPHPLFEKKKWGRGKN